MTFKIKLRFLDLSEGCCSFALIDKIIIKIKTLTLITNEETTQLFSNFLIFDLIIFSIIFSIISAKNDPSQAGVYLARGLGNQLGAHKTFFFSFNFKFKWGFGVLGQNI